MMKRNFYIGQNVIWHCVDYEREIHINAVVTEIHSDHCLAVAKNNSCSNYDNMQLWIDEANEMDFF